MTFKERWDDRAAKSKAGRAELKAMWMAKKTVTREEKTAAREDRMAGKTQQGVQGVVLGPFKKLWGEHWKSRFVWAMLRATAFAPLTWIAVILWSTVVAMVVPVLVTPAIILGFPVIGYFRLLNTIDQLERRERKATDEREVNAQAIAQATARGWSEWAETARTQEEVEVEATGLTGGSATLF